MTSVSIVSAVAARIHLYLEDESKLPQSWRNEAKEFLPGLEKVKTWLQVADQETKQTGEFVELEKKIVRLSYDIDDAMAASDLGSFPSSSSSKTKGRITGIFAGSSSYRSSKSDLNSLRTQLDNITKNLDQSEVTPAATSKKEQAKKIASTAPARQTSIHQVNPGSPTTSTRGEHPPQIENQVRKALLRQDLPVVCIWGKSGMGKTTLAEKAFNHPEVRREFQFFAWVPINQDLQTKNVLQAILLQLLPDEKVEIRAMDEIELTLKVFNVLKDNKCLVVLEDIGDLPDDWRGIRVAFPIDQSSSSSSSSSKSKILITTSSMEVAKVATSKEGVYEMKPLTEAECLKILRENANFEKQELEFVGKKIFRLSRGSPLIAVILGKSLKTVDLAARNQLDHELHSYLSKFHSPYEAGETQVLELSYDRLPYELKPCLLYMGQFPNGRDMEVEKLYLLWAAEHLKISMESVRNMLTQLAAKRIIEVQEDKVSMTRIYKSCRLHDQVRDFCIFKGLGEDFFEVVDFKSDKITKLRPSTRRLAIYLSKYGDGDTIPFSSQDTVKKIRCLLIFDTYESQQKSTWPGEINDLKEFTQLRVLDFDGVDFTVRKSFPRGIDKLLFLRYLSFQGCCLEAFPSYIRQLPYCLETLDLRVTTDRKMTIPANIFSNMKRLRHLFFPLVYGSEGNNELELKFLERLEILVNFDTGACKVADLFHLTKLQILTTISDGNHKDLEVIINCLDGKAANLQHSSLDIKNFDCYSRDRVTVFKKLLECKSLHSLHVEGQIGKLPEDVKISPNFTEVVLNGSELKDDPMNELGKLENLRSLTLQDDAFVGTQMTFSAVLKFPNLRILKLANLQYLEKITFEEGALPMLSTLVIEKCDILRELWMPKALDSRLQHAQEKKGDDVYLVEALNAIKLHDN